jgi:hypothetical protein
MTVLNKNHQGKEQEERSGEGDGRDPAEKPVPYIHAACPSLALSPTSRIFYPYARASLSTSSTYLHALGMMPYILEKQKTVCPVE